MNLNNLGVGGTGQWTLVQATAINDKGQILANGYDGNANEHAFLLDPAKWRPPSVLQNRQSFPQAFPATRLIQVAAADYSSRR